MKYTFKSENNYEGQPNTIVTVDTDAVTLPELLIVIEDFLRGVGFSAKGRLDIIPDEAYAEDDDYNEHPYEEEIYGV